MGTMSVEHAIDAPARLDANLAALSRYSPLAAEMIRRAAPLDGVRLEFHETDDAGAEGATLDGIALASRRRPLEEAERLAGTIDLRDAGAVVVLGFGLGHHVGALARRMRRDGLIVVFEPDVALLRSVFERIDHSAWLTECNVVFMTDADDRPGMSAATRGAEGVLALGVRILAHPPSRARLGDAAKRFGDAFADIVSTVRTVVVTTMVQTEVTIRNLLMNIDHYARTGPAGEGAGVGELEGLCAGRPAIVVAAGPSLQRNIHLLATPGLRDRCVIIAVQTALKQLLAIGVRPHFVTALDYHEISRRFYEGLSAKECADVTLVVEPKANPAILDAFPGPIRCVDDEFLNRVIGAGLAGEHGKLQSGATVAHLAYYLARHLGCDPVALIGQDLAFTDGQYYGAGAAIHDVWAGELNTFNTLEMMEWQRIIRGRATLRPATDHLGRPVYTDEQMATYLAQFERDFLADAQRGLRVVDATEGGVAKAHTARSTLAEFIAREASASAPALPPMPAPGGVFDAARRERARKRLREVRAGAGMVAELSRRAEGLLEKMLDRHDDQGAVNKLIREVDQLRDRVVKIDPAYGLVQRLNQTGGFKRARADRRLRFEQGITELEHQRRQIERDKMNVRWLADAADAFADLLDASLAALDGAPKRTRDPAPPADTESDDDAGEGSPARARSRRVCALIAVDPDVATNGARRSLEAPFLGRSPLRATLERLARCGRLDGAVLLAHDVDRVRALVGDDPPMRTEIVGTEGPPLADRIDGIRAARLWSEASWRGGLCSFTCYDEVCPTGAAAAMAPLGYDAALLVGPDWCLVDPALCDACIERWAERPDRHRLTFCQAPPGLAGCAIDRTLLAELEGARERARTYASIGGLLGYLPVKPQADPIAHPVCVQIPPAVRDTLFRCIPDSDPRRTMLEQALLPYAQGGGWSAVRGMSAEQIATALLERQKDVPSGMPKEVTLELCTGRRVSGRRLAWIAPDHEALDRPVLAMEIADRVFSAVGEQRSDAVVNLAGAGDPLLHPRCAEVVRLAKSRGVAGVHVRTDLLAPPDAVDALLESGVDVISVDVLANTAATYKALTGFDGFRTVLENLDRLLQRRRSVAGLPHPWIVPRITRCDAVYEEIEAFYDKWLLVAGAAMIDQLPRPIEGDRIEPLGKPNRTRRRDWRSRLFVLSDGVVVMDERDGVGARPVGNIAVEPVATVWRRLLDRRRTTFREHGFSHPDLWTGW